MQGEQFKGVADALRNGDLDAAGLQAPERLLLEFVATITDAAYKVTDEQVQALAELLPHGGLCATTYFYRELGH